MPEPAVFEGVDEGDYTVCATIAPFAPDNTRTARWIELNADTLEVRCRPVDVGTGTEAVRL